MGMNGLCRRRRPEQPGGLGIAIPIGLFGKSKVLPVGLRFAGESFLEVFLGGNHLSLLVGYNALNGN
jgi:hypothetical protein